MDHQTSISYNEYAAEYIAPLVVTEDRQSDEQRAVVATTRKDGASW